MKIKSNKIFKIALKTFLILWSLLVFLLWLELLKHSLVEIINPATFFKFLWSPIKSFLLSYMMTEITMSGSPIAWAFVWLWEALNINPMNMIFILMWTRWGVNSVLLITWLMLLIKQRSLRRALGITVIQFFVTFSVTLLSATYVAYFLNWWFLDVVAKFLTSNLNNYFSISQFIGNISNIFVYNIANIYFILILWILFLFGWLFAFDKSFSFINSKSAEKKIKKIETIRNAFIFWFVLTALTMSLSISVTFLLPLYVRKIVTRRYLIAYILGANISTLFDTLLLGMVANTVLWVKAVLAFILANIISVSIFFSVYTIIYRKVIYYITDKILDRKFLFLLFLFVIMVLPIIMVFVL